ncbi:MAG TPA: hypothetical protein VHO03_06750 [Ignavibacteriales bacterium]|nr:hypothetical protein [Ignavibacteriales bacterium]
MSKEKPNSTKTNEQPLCFDAEGISADTVPAEDERPTADVKTGKPRKTNKRRLATEKNVINQKKKRLKNLDSRLSQYRKIRRRGYVVRKTKDGNEERAYLSAAEKEWYGIKIEELRLETAELRESICQLSTGLKDKARTTKNIAKERYKKYQQNKKASAEAKKILKDFSDKLKISLQNGHKPLSDQIKALDVKDEKSVD